ncbi:MAG TPA: hypothetical protein VLG74_12595, partial [Blastocatellia bacterium]|nr:hypothetical protein [Blastocatellia bacterium]
MNAPLAVGARSSQRNSTNKMARSRKAFDSGDSASTDLLNLGMGQQIYIETGHQKATANGPAAGDDFSH